MKKQLLLFYINNQGLEVERSTDNQTFIPLGFINSNAANTGNSTMPLQYTYVDNTPITGANFYRLKQVEPEWGCHLQQNRHRKFNYFRCKVKFIPQYGR